MHKKADSYRKSYKNYIVLVCVMLISSMGILYKVDAYQSPKLYGRWQSKETGEYVIFNTDGTVSLESTNDKFTYTLTTPNKMLYTIGDKTFSMVYYLEGRILQWGMDENLKETFIRK